MVMAGSGCDDAEQVEHVIYLLKCDCLIQLTFHDFFLFCIWECENTMSLQFTSTCLLNAVQILLLVDGDVDAATEYLIAEREAGETTEVNDVWQENYEIGNVWLVNDACRENYKMVMAGW